MKHIYMLECHTIQEVFIYIYIYAHVCVCVYTHAHAKTMKTMFIKVTHDRKFRIQAREMT